MLCVEGVECHLLVGSCMGSAQLRCDLSLRVPLLPSSCLSDPTHPHLPLSLRVCARCGVAKEAAPGGKLQQCSRCKEEGKAPVYFCSDACMAEEWPTHKIVCSPKGTQK